MKKRDYEDFYFEVRNKNGKLVATFQVRWMAEQFAIQYECTVEKIYLISK